MEKIELIKRLQMENIQIQKLYKELSDQSLMNKEKLNLFKNENIKYIDECNK